MALTATQVQTLAELTQLRLDSTSLEHLANSLSQQTDNAESIRDIETGATEPLISPLDMTQRLRADEVTESNQRDLYQSLAPATEDGLYLVPKVLD